MEVMRYLITGCLTLIGMIILLPFLILGAVLLIFSIWIFLQMFQ